MLIKISDLFLVAFRPFSLLIFKDLFLRKLSTLLDREYLIRLAKSWLSLQSPSECTERNGSL